jgi:hypothetical protein
MHTSYVQQLDTSPIVYSSLKRETSGKPYNTLVHCTETCTYVWVWAGHLLKGVYKNWGRLSGRYRRKFMGQQDDKEGWQIKHNYKLYDLHNVSWNSEYCQTGEAEEARTPNQGKRDISL